MRLLQQHLLKYILFSKNKTKKVTRHGLNQEATSTESDQLESTAENLESNIEMSTREHLVYQEYAEDMK